MHPMYRRHVKPRDPERSMAIVDKAIAQALAHEAQGNQGAADVRWEMADRILRDLEHQNPEPVN